MIRLLLILQCFILIRCISCYDSCWRDPGLQNNI